MLKIIEDLAAEGRLNGQTFCIQCMVLVPESYPIYTSNCFLGPQTSAFEALSGVR